MNIVDVLYENYLPYAKSVILNRAVPAIDGLKPSQRRVLYTMYDMKLLDANAFKKKCTNIVGKVAPLHPHGDSSIYETLVYLTDNRGSLNVPYIEGKGNFGDTRMPEEKYAAMRYTEAKLHPSCKYMFEGINEGAVDIVDNFDGTEKEPTLLPVQYPNILVNSNSGIAVGVSSSIPSYALPNVCKATAGMALGEIDSPEKLAEALGVPEFPTGCTLHTDQEGLVKLCTVGKGSFVLTATTEVYSDKIVVREIPYNTSVASIIHDIDCAVKDKIIPEISDARDASEYGSFKIIIYLKRGSDARNVLQRLYRVTSLRNSISFNTVVIIDNDYKTIGVYELLQDWISWRLETIRRMYQYRLDRSIEKEAKLSAWEKVKGRVLEAVEIVTRSKRDLAKRNLMGHFDMTEAQADYFVDLRIGRLTEDNVEEQLRALDKLKEEIASYTEMVESKEKRVNLMVNQLVEIYGKLGSRRKTMRADKIVEDDTELKRKISEEDVRVIYTKQGFIKRLETATSILNFRPNEGDSIVENMLIKNNDYILVMTVDGDCHKILVDDIDSSRGGCKIKLHQMLGLSNAESIVKVIPAGDYSGSFTIMYPSGKAEIVTWERCSGKRKQYKNLFNPVDPGNYWIVDADKFFVVTFPSNKKNYNDISGIKACYVDLSVQLSTSKRAVLRVTQPSSRDMIIGYVPLEDVPDISKIDIEAYKKPYPILIDFNLLRKNPNKEEEGIETEESTPENTVTEAAPVVDYNIEELLANANVEETEYEE